jgi:hypothetical protein
MREVDMQKRALLIFATGLLLIAGCGSGTSSGTTSKTTSATGTSLSLDVQPIFNNSCVVCHQGAGQAGLALEPANAYKNLVNVASTEAAALKRVAPGDPSHSYLLNKLNGTQVQSGGSGAQMPYGAQPLAAGQISAIQQWIQAGAANN